MSVSVIAIDWSGDLKNARKKIWLAEAVDGSLARLECGRDREEVAGYLRGRAVERRLVVGFDFAFSLTAWFLDSLGLNSGPRLWERVREDGEAWLERCEPPFWGRRGHKRPAVIDGPAYRKGDLPPFCPPIMGIRAKSVFQVGGSGSVGTGSLRGMPVLLALQDSGFHVWPFDPPGWPLAVEIYPRLLTGPVTKSSHERRRDYLTLRFPGLDRMIFDLAASSEDAFDAAVSALVMAEHVDKLESLPAVSDPQLRLEGIIWHPALPLDKL